jgi:ethanolamine utilization protein EutQ (cupin superfamily)
MKKLFFLLSIAYGVSSCLTYKDIVNFQDGQDLSTGRLDSITNFAKWTIQSEDILMVNVFSSNQEAVRQFNIMNPGTVGNMQMFGGQRMSEAMIG